MGLFYIVINNIIRFQVYYKTLHSIIIITSGDVLLDYTWYVVIGKYLPFDLDCTITDSNIM